MQVDVNLKIDYSFIAKEIVRSMTNQGLNEDQKKKLLANAELIMKNKLGYFKDQDAKVKQGE